MVSSLHAKLKAVLNNKVEANINQQQVGLLNLFNKQEIVVVAPEAKRNEAAFVVGVLGGLFGILGISYIFNHDVPRGLAWLILGTVCYWAFILIVAAILISVSEVLIILAIVIHLLIIWNHAKQGAHRNPHPAQKKKLNTQ